MLYQKLVKIACISCCMYFLQPANTFAQQAVPTDTVRLNIKEVEKIFLEKNLDLLAQHYDIEVNKALIEQAKLWDNPVLNTDQNVYSNNRFFEHSKNPEGGYNGQYYVQVQQLIKTANKRGKLVQMARTNATISEWQFKEVMRNLKYQLRSDFYTVVQLERNRNLYNQEKEQINKLLEGMNALYKSGNIALKDLMRIQALQLSINQEATDNDKQLETTEAELKTMLQIAGNVYVAPVIEDGELPKAPDMGVGQLVDLARQNNSGYQLQQLQVQYQQQNVSYQKALAVPDVTLGPNFDKNSNYIPNYWGLGISLPLPLWNRNQGNIRSAQWQVKEEQANLQQVDLQLQNGVMSAYNKLLATLKLSAQPQQEFYSNYNKLYNNIVESYRQRQISLIEFIDYFDAYKDIRQKQLQQELNLQLAKEELNLQVGTDVIP